MTKQRVDSNDSKARGRQRAHSRSGKMRIAALAAGAMIVVAACSSDSDDSTVETDPVTSDATASPDGTAASGTEAPPTDSAAPPAETVNPPVDSVEPPEPIVELAFDLEANPPELQGVTDTSVKVGGLSTLTSPRLATFTGVDVGAQVYFDSVNANGGIAGRQIDFIGVKDDGENNEQNITQARSLVEEEEVFAVVPVVSSFFAGSSVLQDVGIPYFGWGFHEAFCDTPEGFSFNGCGNPKVDDHPAYAWPGLIAELYPDAKTVAFSSEDTEAARAGVDRYLRSLDELGLEEVLVDTGIPIDPGTDYTPFAQRIIEANPDVVFIVSGASTAIQLAGRLQASGFEGKVTTPAIYDPRVLAVESAAQAVEGATAYVGFATFQSEDNPGIAQLKADVAEFAPEGTVLTQPLASGYFSAMLFSQILEAVGTDLTYEAFYEAANSTVFDGGGALAALTFPEAHSFPRECGALAGVVDSVFVEAVELTCIR